jgi:predicted anti-sigma-YlaC factor YlaD
MTAFSVDCTWTQEHMERYIDGELLGNELEAFERHIESCETCREELFLAKEVLSELRALPQQSCPDSVVEDAAARIGPSAISDTDTWFDRLRGRIVRVFTPLPKQAAAVLLVVIVAALAAVLLQHDRLSLTGIGEPPSKVAVTDEELESAKLDVILAFAYVEKYSRLTCDVVKQEGITDRVINTLGRTIAEPMFPFPLEE